MAAEIKPQLRTYLPAGTKATGGSRVDFRPDDFDRQIAVKGQRVWWSRAGLCPCRGNLQTKQADPTCTLCAGKGYYYFIPSGISDGEADDDGYKIEVSDDGNAVGIQALITSVTNDPQIFERFGQWIFGVARATTASRNRINYRDRLLCRDTSLPFDQLIEADGQQEIAITGMRSTSGLWTRLSRVVALRSKTTIYEQGSDFNISDGGTITWAEDSVPDAGTVLSLSAEHRPAWIVTEHIHGTRDTYVAKKRQAATKEAEFQQLPPAAQVKLDFLLDS